MRLIWPHSDVWQGIEFAYAVINKENGKPFSIFVHKIDADFYCSFLKKTYPHADFEVIELENNEEC